MARYDKYDSENGGFRAPLNASLSLSGQGYGPIGVGLNANGKVVPGAGNTGIVGLLVKNMPAAAQVGNTTIGGITAPGSLAGDIVDVMTDGEIVDITGFVAGTTYWADVTTGVLAAAQAGGAAPAAGTGSGAGSKKVGFTVEATRLVVRFGRS
jgi:hypothetical protein